MNKQEILAAIQAIEEQFSVLKSLVDAEPVEVEKVEQVVVEKTTVTTTKTTNEFVLSYDDEVKLSCGILSQLPLFYDGKCTYIKIHKRYQDNGKPKVFLDKNRVVITAYNDNDAVIGSITVMWDNLMKYQIPLIQMGINTHDKTTWMPKVLSLMAD